MLDDQLICNIQNKKSTHRYCWKGLLMAACLDPPRPHSSCYIKQASSRPPLTLEILVCTVPWASLQASSHDHFSVSRQNAGSHPIPTTRNNGLTSTIHPCHGGWNESYSHLAAVRLAVNVSPSSCGALMPLMSAYCQLSCLSLKPRDYQSLHWTLPVSSSGNIRCLAKTCLSWL